MASEGLGDAPEASSSAPPRITKPKRQRIKHDGKPPLQFIVSTSDLSQFRDEDVKRNVRSQAMLVWRQKDRERRAPKGNGKATPVEPPDEPSVEPSGSEAPANVDNVKPGPDDFEPMDDVKPVPDDTKPDMERLSLSTSEGSSASSSHMLDEPPQGQQIPHSPTYLAWWGSVPLSDYEEYGEEQDAYGGTSSQTLVLRKTVDYEESEKHETHTYKGLIHQLAAFYQVGNGADPFDALPQFENPELNSLYLTRNSVRAFTTELTMKKWFPAIVSHPHMILSSTCLVTTWLDMKQGHSGDSKRTAMVKEETFQMLNQRLQDPRLQSDDTTLMGILHVLAGEMWNCDENALRVHIKGVAQFVNQRGGLEKLGRNGALADVTVSSCCHCDILFETRPLPLFHAWEPAPIDLKVSLPESPVFCPHNEYLTICNSRRCSSATYSLLCDMRNLTVLLLEESTRLNRSPGVKLEGAKEPVDYGDIVTGIQQRLFLLPSAHTPGLAISGDWVYEACRIASLIYTAAIVERVPFSTAAGSPVSTLGDPAHPNTPPRLVESLYETLERCDMFDVWDDMAGVLYWTSSVGAAAARTPPTGILPHAQTQQVAYRIWVQRCLTMYSVRTMIVVIFQHPSAIIQSQKTLLRVQRLLDSKARMM